MTPMPPHIANIQTAYADLMFEVGRVADPLGLNPPGALMLAFIGDQEVRAGQLRERDYYIGSNVSYNLKLLENAGYINKQRGMDRRERRISLTPKGLALAEAIRKALSQRKRKEAA